MRSAGANELGRFSVEFEVANNDDLALVRRGFLPPDQVRRETIQGIVDSGATKLVLPEGVVNRLGLHAWQYSSRSVTPTAARPARGRGRRLRRTSRSPRHLHRHLSNRNARPP